MFDKRFCGYNKCRGEKRMKNSKKQSNTAFERDLYLQNPVACATECTGRNAVEPESKAMADGFEELYKTIPKPVGKKPADKK